MPNSADYHEIITMAAVSDVGSKRRENEDSYCFSESKKFMVVCDGMGGYKKGAMASKIAVSTLSDLIFARETVTQLIVNNKLFSVSKACKDIRYDLPAPALKLISGVRLANRHIFSYGQQDHRMGTTVISAVFHQGHIIVTHVGDSRIYRLRDSEISCLTTDHSWLNYQIEKKKRSEKDTENYKRTNLLTRALGTKPRIKVDVQIAPVKSGDLYLMCSDGLYNALTIDRIRSVLSENHASLQDKVTCLVNKAKLINGSDNITCGLMHISGQWNATKHVEYTVNKEPPKVTQYLDRSVRSIYSVNVSSSNLNKKSLAIVGTIISILILVAYFSIDKSPLAQSEKLKEESPLLSDEKHSREDRLAASEFHSATNFSPLTEQPPKMKTQRVLAQTEQVEKENDINEIIKDNKDMLSAHSENMSSPAKRSVLAVENHSISQAEPPLQASVHSPNDQPEEIAQEKQLSPTSDESREQLRSTSLRGSTSDSVARTESAFSEAKASSPGGSGRADIQEKSTASIRDSEFEFPRDPLELNALKSGRRDEILIAFRIQNSYSEKLTESAIDIGKERRANRSHISDNASLDLTNNTTEYAKPILTEKFQNDQTNLSLAGISERILTSASSTIGTEDYKLWNKFNSELDRLIKGRYGSVPTEFKRKREGFLINFSYPDGVKHEIHWQYDGQIWIKVIGRTNKTRIQELRKALNGLLSLSLSKVGSLSLSLSKVVKE